MLRRLFYLILGSALLLLTLYLGYSIYLLLQAPPDPIISPQQSPITNAAIVPIVAIREFAAFENADYLTYIFFGIAGLSLVAGVVLVGYAFERR